MANGQSPLPFVDNLEASTVEGFMRNEVVGEEAAHDSSLAVPGGRHAHTFSCRTGYRVVANVADDRCLRFGVADPSLLPLNPLPAYTVLSSLRLSIETIIPAVT